MMLTFLKECIHCVRTNKAILLGLWAPSEFSGLCFLSCRKSAENLRPTSFGLYKGSEELNMGHVNATKQEYEFEPNLKQAWFLLGCTWELTSCCLLGIVTESKPESVSWGPFKK